VRPRRLIGASGRPLNFTVRFRERQSVPDDTEFSLDDLPPDAEEEARYAALTQQQRLLIDQLLLARSSNTWQKMARIVATAMLDVPSDLADLSYGYFAQRLRHFVATGQLEARGNLSVMRHCELRLRSPSGRET